jgi:hypothetical protein
LLLLGGLLLPCLSPALLLPATLAQSQPGRLPDFRILLFYFG